MLYILDQLIKKIKLKGRVVLSLRILCFMLVIFNRINLMGKEYWYMKIKIIILEIGIEIKH